MAKVTKATPKKKATAAPAMKTAAKKPAARKKTALKAESRPKAKQAMKTPKVKKAASPQKKKAPVKPQKQQNQQNQAPAGGSSVLWKFLEMKEQRRRQHQAEQAGSPQMNNTQAQFDSSHQRHSKFSRFAGPRRRAA